MSFEQSRYFVCKMKNNADPIYICYRVFGVVERSLSFINIFAFILLVLADSCIVR